jgi:hypothetical protein
MHSYKRPSEILKIASVLSLEHTKSLTRLLISERSITQPYVHKDTQQTTATRSQRGEQHVDLPHFKPSVASNLIMLRTIKHIVPHNDELIVDIFRVEIFRFRRLSTKVQICRPTVKRLPRQLLVHTVGWSTLHGALKQCRVKGRRMTLQLIQLQVPVKRDTQLLPRSTTVVIPFARYRVQYRRVDSPV